MIYRLLSLLAVVFLAGGCGSTAPAWHGGFLDSLDDYYDQGTGGGATKSAADKNAKIALVGYREGIQVDNITEDKLKSVTENGNELVVEVFTSKGVETITGTVPPGTFIAQSWQHPSGTWWSYATFPKSGQERRIEEMRDRRLGSARLRSIIPGWAQLTKGERQKGMRLLAAEGLGLVGLATFVILQADYEDRRDRVRGDGPNARDDRQYYDDWANRFYWGSVAFGTLAGATYIYSLVDGITHIPPTYQLLLSKTHVQPMPAGLALAFRYELD
ncbi:MAG: hypothetical protein GKR89_12620 [Candidatus Latescibacteria bacterium]|nr:hypothetical protein [Candidatus Latescibacterota bacterium]